MLSRDLQHLAEETFDVLVLGGGINGLATAWDCSLRGLKVALVEKGDYGGETSAASLKIIHGGLRYLQHGDFIRMRESTIERRSFFRMVPHLVDPFPFLVPTYGYGLKGKAAMALAMRINDWVSWDRNKGLVDEKKHIPSGQVVDRNAVLRYAPDVPAEGLTGGAIFYDGRMYNSERVTLSFALSAAAKGATLANYVCAEQLLPDGAEVRDLLSGDTFKIKSRVIVSALGPWTDPFLNQKPVKYSAGMQIITRAVTTEGMGLAVPGAAVDPDAKIDRGGRHYFTTPWRGHTIWGTTDDVYEGDPAEWRIDDLSVQRFVDELNQALPKLALKSEDVIHAYGGLRPLDEKNLNTGSQVSRKYEIFTHDQPNLLSMVGVKYTACRVMAEKMTDLVFTKLGREASKCKTAETPLIGGNFETMESLCRSVRKNAPESLKKPKIQHLLRNYGTMAEHMIAQIKDDPSLGEFVPGSEEVLKVQVKHAIEMEGAQTPDDIMLRRTDLGTLGPVNDETRIYCEKALALPAQHQADIDA